MKTLTCILHHHIGSESDFEIGLGISSSRKAYEAQIEWIKTHYNAIDLETLLSGDLPPRPILLTFDDAFYSSFEVIRDVLEPHGLPSVFFINPGLLEDHSISLDSTIAWATIQTGIQQICKFLDLPQRSTVGEIIRYDMSQLSAVDRGEVKELLLKEYGPPDFDSRARLMCASEVVALNSLGAEVGNHTTNHVHCRSLTSLELETEIIDSKMRLEALTGQKVRSFSVPYGHSDDLTDPVLKALRTSGHEAIFLVHARSNILRPSKDIWYRVSLHNEAPRNLPSALHIKPLLRTIKHTIKL